MANIEERGESVVKKPIEVIYTKEGKDWYLRIFIENEVGISLEDCEKVNNAIDELLDQANVIKDPYFLEVSSTGVEKVLRKDWHLSETLGEKVIVSLFKPMNGKKEIISTLKSFNETDIELEELTIPRKDISMIKKYYDWGN